MPLRRFAPSYSPPRAKLEKLYDDSRGSSTARGYDWAWRRCRALKLKQSPLCEDCLNEDKIVIAEMVHHIEEVSKRPDLRLAANNLMSLCNRHHSVHHGKA